MVEEPAKTDLEAGRNTGRIQFVELEAPDSGARGRARSLSRRQSLDSLSIRSLSRSRTVDPGVLLPIHYRTLSFNVEETKEAGKRELVEKTTTPKKAEVEFAEVDWHKISVDEVCERLSTSSSRGLSFDQVSQRLKQYGRNVLSPPSSTWFRKTISYLFGGFGSLLMMCSILVFISWKPLGSPPALANLALAIVLAIVWLIQAFFAFFQDWSSSRVMASIKNMLPDECFVIRNGEQLSISAVELVPGDLITFKPGSKLPADVRFVQLTADAAFDRSILTGEVVPLRGLVDSNDDNYLETACIGLAGTHCTNGSGLGLILDTGDRTVFGRLASLTNKPKNTLTNLEKEIYIFVGIIAAIMMAMVVLVLIVWATWLRKDHPGWISVPVLIVDCVSVAVAFIPEGLPIAITASLTITARVMKRNKVLCKSLKTVETLGTVSIICSDKTGTLTKNQMTVTDCMMDGKSLTAQAAAELLHLSEEEEDSAPSLHALKQLRFLGAVCNAGEFDPTTLHLPLESRRIMGDATDQAILRFAEGLGSVSGLRSAWKVVSRIPFNSKNKYMTHIVEPSSAALKHNATQEKILTIKGAPDILLPRCSHMLSADGTLTKLTDESCYAIEEMKDRWSSQAKRVILLAQKDISSTFPDRDPNNHEFDEYMNLQCSSGLVLVGLVAIVDPPREEIPDVVRTLRRAGVKLFMVTGDFKLTAQAIAAECGIITQSIERTDDVTALSQFYSSMPLSGTVGKDAVSASSVTSLVLSGGDLTTLDEAHWDAVARYDEVVFARTTPEQKLKIVKELQARGEVVGMTGDGVNDAPSLKAADIGIAMGSGSDIAIEASDMVLLESFAAIVEAVKYGRVVFDNLRKTICYLLPAGSFSEFWPVMTNVVFGLPQVLSSFLMIIICCCTDAAAATAIAYEKPEADVLLRRPRNPRKDHLVDWKLILQAYGFVGVVETVSSFAMSYWYAQRSGVAFSGLFFGFGENGPGLSDEAYGSVLNRASSIYFVNLVVMQWFTLMALRTRRLSILSHPPLFRRETRNLYLFPAIGFALLIVVFFLYVPKFQQVFGNLPVPVAHWFLPMAFGMGLLLLDEGRKAWVRRWPQGWVARVAW